MNSKTLRRQVRVFEAAHKDALGTDKGPEATFLLDLRPEFQWPQVEIARRDEDDQRRSVGVERGENRIAGGSDPTLSGIGAAQRLRRRGSLPPKLSSRVPRSVAGRVAERKPNQPESITAEEIKRWP